MYGWCSCVRECVCLFALHECVDEGCVSVICESVCVLIGGLLSWKIIHLSPSGPLAADTSLLHHTLTHTHTFTDMHMNGTSTRHRCSHSVPRSSPAILETFFEDDNTELPLKCILIYIFNQCGSLWFLGSAVCRIKAFNIDCKVEAEGVQQTHRLILEQPRRSFI